MQICLFFRSVLFLLANKHIDICLLPNEHKSKMKGANIYKGVGSKLAENFVWIVLFYISNFNHETLVLLCSTFHVESENTFLWIILVHSTPFFIEVTICQLCFWYFYFIFSRSFKSTFYRFLLYWLNYLLSPPIIFL